jgi:hypothetical protein
MKKKICKNRFVPKNTTKKFGVVIKKVDSDVHVYHENSNLCKNFALRNFSQANNPSTKMKWEDEAYKAQNF